MKPPKNPTSLPCNRGRSIRQPFFSARAAIGVFLILVVGGSVVASLHAIPGEEKPSRQEVRLGPTVLTVPSGWRPQASLRRQYLLEGWRMDVYSRGFARGDLCYAEILPPAGSGQPPADTEHALYYKGSIQRQVPLHRFGEGWQGVFLIPPEQNADTTLTWVMKRGGEVKKKPFSVSVHLTVFPESRSVLPFDSKFADPTKVNQADLMKRLEEERSLKSRAFSTYSDWSFDSHLSHPRDFHYITSPFFISRLNERYVEKNGKRVFLEPQRSVHRGLDFRGLPGTPVFALAPGSVVLAHDMYYEGNFTVVDHGFGIFTGYMHQNRLLVKPGDRVKAGQQIGEVGGTGMVTAAHLHLSVWVWGLPGDPLSLLSLPLR